MFAEQALGEFPVGRQLTGLLHQGVNPGDAAGDVGIFDAMTCLRVVFHYLACAASAQLVDLEEDCGPRASDADAVFLDEGLDYHRVDDGLEEGNEAGVLVEADAACKSRLIICLQIGENMWKSKPPQCGNHSHPGREHHRKRKRPAFGPVCSRFGPTSLFVGTMWELFGKANAPEHFRGIFGGA